jgi:hypothetical protein
MLFHTLPNRRTVPSDPQGSVWLAARIAGSKKRLDPAPLNRRIGRILQHNHRAAARFAAGGSKSPRAKR